MQDLPDEFVEASRNLVSLANATLAEIMASDRAPAAARVSAANAVLDRDDRARARERDRSLQDKTLGELTVAELEALALSLARKKAALEAVDAQIIEPAALLPASDQ